LNILDIQNISFSFSNQKLIDNCSFEIEEKSQNFLIGLNGSGKTTLLKILLGLLNKKKGKIFILGKNQNEYTSEELAKIIAFVPQTQSEIFPFSVEEIISTGRTPFVNFFGVQSQRDKEIIDEFITKLDLNSVRKKQITKISGGELRRTLIARALVQQPKILLLDEPNSYLDVEHQISIFEILAKLSDEQKLTTITVTHDLNIAFLFAQNVLILHEGKIKKGKKEEILTENNIKYYFHVNSKINFTDNYSTISILRK